MDLLHIEKFVGYRTAILDSAGTFVDGIVDKTALDVFINDRYKDLFMEFAEKYPEHYEVNSLFNLVANQRDYVLGGDALDHLELRYMGIKYSSSATEFTRVRQKDYRALFDESTDSTLYSTTSPFYYKSAQRDTGSPNDDLYRSVGIVPTPSASVTNGLTVRYVEIPNDMTLDEDSPTAIPSTCHKLIALYAVADVWEAKGDTAKSERALNRAMMAQKTFFDNYQPSASDEPAYWSPDRNFNSKIRRWS